MKNEQLLKAIQNANASFVEAVKAMTQLSNAVLELKEKSDLNKNEKQNELKIIQQCEELIEKFIPMVNKWRFEGNTIINEAEHYNGAWSYSDNNKRTAAIRCAIKHCELMLTDKKLFHPDWLQEMNLIYLQLQKMLSE